MAPPESSSQKEFPSLQDHESSSEVPSPPRHRTWPWLLFLFLLILGGFVYYLTRTRDQSVAAGKQLDRGGATVSVAVTPVEREDVPYYLAGLGSVTAYNTVTVKSRVDGQLQAIYFKEGQDVQAGELLAEIDPRPFQVALAQAEGQLAKDQAALRDAHLDDARYKQLVKEGVIAQQQSDTQVATVGQLDGAIRADQAMIDNQNLQLTYCKITAPISGRVGLRLVDAGNIVHAADANGMLVITQVQPIAVIFTLPEDNLPQVLKRMQQGTLPVEAYSRDEQTKIATGKLETLDNQIDPTTGTVRLKAVFDNHHNELWPNQFVNIHLMLDVRKNAIVVPLAAIQRGVQGSYVYVVGNGQAQIRPVTVDLNQGNISLISSGLQEGEQVVVDGQDKLQAGSTVETRIVPLSAATQTNTSSGAYTGNGSGATPQPANSPAAGKSPSKQTGGNRPEKPKQ